MVLMLNEILSQYGLRETDERGQQLSFVESSGIGK